MQTLLNAIAPSDGQSGGQGGTESSGASFGMRA
jgi:hypothetical protein